MPVRLRFQVQALLLRRACWPRGTHRRPENAAALPALRPDGVNVLSFCKRAEERLGEHAGMVPDDVVAGGVALVDDTDRASTVSTFCKAAACVWEQLRGIADRAERELVGSAVRGAICDHWPMPRMQLLVIETEENLPAEVGVGSSHSHR